MPPLKTFVGDTRALSIAMGLIGCIDPPFNGPRVSVARTADVGWRCVGSSLRDDSTVTNDDCSELRELSVSAIFVGV